MHDIKLVKRGEHPGPAQQVDKRFVEEAQTCVCIDPVSSYSEVCENGHEFNKKSTERVRLWATVFRGNPVDCKQVRDAIVEDLAIVFAHLNLLGVKIDVERMNL